MEKNNEFAFPHIVGQDETVRHGGLTKREYYASQVLAVMASHRSMADGDLAGIAVKLADALIENLKR